MLLKDVEMVETVFLHLHQMDKFVLSFSMTLIKCQPIIMSPLLITL